MPTTLQGFLIVSGLLMFVFSFFSGGIEYKDIKLPKLLHSGRISFRILGILFMVLGGALYALPIINPDWFEKLTALPLLGN